MKQILALLLLAVTSFANAQSAKTIFTTDDLVWYGVDFTKAKMIGAFGASGGEVKDRFFNEWNYLILDQPNKYEIGKFFRKTSVFKDMEPVQNRNATVDASKLMSYNETQITKEQVAEMVKQYKGGEKKEGLGLVFIVENFNKQTAQASAYVTFFDIATKKVLLTQKLYAQPSGGGVRNYWAGAIYRMMVKINETEYNNWRTQYGN